VPIPIGSRDSCAFYLQSDFELVPMVEHEAVVKAVRITLEDS
jgi:hypothetical protein